MRLLLRLWILGSLGWVGYWGFEHRERLGFYARTWLDAKSNEMDRVFIFSLLLGDLQKLVMQALLPHSATYGITAEHLQAVIAGCQMDLDQTRYLDFAGLQRYCHLVAGIVGEVAARIFGHADPATLDYAHRLGRALQLTNIIRDVGDDARRGRIYLPASELQRFDVKPHELLKREAPWGYSDRFTALMSFQAERAHATYDQALAMLPEADRAAQKPGLMMANIYRSLLREIEADGFQVLHQRTSLTPLRKLWIALRTHWRGR